MWGSSTSLLEGESLSNEILLYSVLLHWKWVFCMTLSLSLTHFDVVLLFFVVESRYFSAHLFFRYFSSSYVILHGHGIHWRTANGGRLEGLLSRKAVRDRLALQGGTGDFP